MLYPQQNDRRNLLELSGYWDFQLDPQREGEARGWQDALPSPRVIAVPGSWNEQFQDTKDYLGTAWYQREVYVPSQWRGQRVFIRVGSANYAASVWVNGQRVGSHEGGHLPFAFEITDLVAWGRQNTLSIAVDAELTRLRVPPGNIPGEGMGFLRSYPAASFDFFPYAGIHRPVYLYALPTTHIDDVTVTTEIEGDTGIVKVVAVQSGPPLKGEVSLAAEGEVIEAPLSAAERSEEIVLHVPSARLWSPDDPYLYDLTLALTAEGGLVDRYTLPVGIRTIAVSGDRILLNGEQIMLRGFGKHEDFPIHGRGLNLPLIVKDAALLKWVGANSYRTAHYPYSEEAMRMADRQGFLIVDETPAVGLLFTDGDDAIAARLKQVRQQVTELIARDKNHPSVIMWSLANEPVITKGGFHDRDQDVIPAAVTFFTELFELARDLDPTRLVTLESPIGSVENELLALCDVICTHQYPAWYTDSGRLDLGAEHMADALDALAERYRKPIAVTEYGADTVAGWHSDPPEMWTEEYQLEQLRRLLDYAASRPFIAGIHLWNFADFKTGQSILRARGMNHKGLFTRDRQPKMAAHFLRARWRER